jgi:hypothetical protein
MATARTDLSVVIRAINEATGTIQGLGEDFKKLFAQIKRDSEGTQEALEKIASTLSESLQGSSSSLRKASAEQREALKKTGEAASQSSDGIRLLEASIISLASQMRNIVRFGIAGLIYELLLKPIVNTIESLGEMASRGEALRRSMVSVGTAAGFAKRDILEAADAIERLGAQSDAASESLTRLASAGISPQVAVRLAEAAKRLAIAYDKSFNETLADLTNAAARGSTYLLSRKYGIQIDAEQAIIAKQAELNRLLTPSERPLAITEALISLLLRKFPELNRESQSLRETQDAIVKSWNDVGEELGKFVLPLLERGKRIAVSLLETVKETLVFWNKLFNEFSPSQEEEVAHALARAEANVQRFRQAYEYALSKLKEAEAQADPSKSAYYKKHVEATFSRLNLAELERDSLKIKLQELIRKRDAGKAEGQAGDTAPKPSDVEDEKDVIAKLRQKLQMAKAAAEGAAALRRKELEELKAHNTQLEALDRARYDDGILSLEEYFSRRRQREQAEFEKQKEVAQAMVRAAAADVEYIKRAGQGTLNSPEGIAAVNKLTEARKQLNIVQAQYNVTLAQTNIEENKARDAIDIQLRDLSAQIEALRDPLSIEAALQTLTNKYIDLRKKFKGLHEDKLRDLELTEKQIATYNKLAEIRDYLARRVNLGFQLEEAQIKLAESQGLITSSEAIQRRNALITKRIELERAQIATIRETIDQLALEGRELEKLNDKIAEHEANIVNLQSSYESLGKTIRERFTSDLANFFSSLLTRTKSLKDALRDLGRATVQQLADIAGRKAAEGVVQIIVNATGGPNGIFGDLARILSERGTEYNPMVVTLSKRDLLFPQGGKGGPFGSASSFFGEFLGGLFGAGGGGDFFAGAGAGDIGGFFGAPVMLAAEGGPVVGPSHAGGGVMINAEGGEFVVKKGPASRWAGLLTAINSGFMDSVIPSRGTVFASGGLVDSSDKGSMNVSITINDGLASANGDSSRAATFAKTLVPLIQHQIAKERRAGGLLDPNKL